MALTDHCNVFGSVHEDGFNKILLHIKRQRPSLFNYGTRFFALRPERMCRKIDPHPEVIRRGNPLVTIEDPLPIPGTGGRFGIDFCAQLTSAKIDFHRENVIKLPPELAPLPKQAAALSAEFCVGLSCPASERADFIGDAVADIEARDKRDQDGPRPPIQPIPGEEVICFCLEVFATVRIVRIGTDEGDVLVPRLGGIEIVDIQPEGLENTLECYVATTLRVGILPKLRFAVDTFIENLGEFMGLTPGLTPISASVPNNPAIEDDQLKVFVDMGF
jgi:hypothetical protein